MTTSVQTQTCKFPTYAVLCVASKLIPEQTMLPEVFKVLEYMTQGPVSTLLMNRAMNEAHSYLLFRQPQLALTGGITGDQREAVRDWFADMQSKHGETIEVMR